MLQFLCNNIKQFLNSAFSNLLSQTYLFPLSLFISHLYNHLLFCPHLWNPLSPGHISSDTNNAIFISFNETNCQEAENTCTIYHCAVFQSTRCVQRLMRRVNTAKVWMARFNKHKGKEKNSKHCTYRNTRHIVSELIRLWNSSLELCGWLLMSLLSPHHWH